MGVRRIRWRAAWVVGAVAVVVAAVGIGVPTAALGAAGLTATFTKTSDWGSGWEARYDIRNGGATTVNGWTMEFDMPAGGAVGSFWEANVTRNGQHYVATNKAYNGTIAPGGSTYWGFIGSGGVPLNCTINGAPCAGGPGPTTGPPTSSPTPTPTTPSPSPTTSPTPSPTPTPTVTPPPGGVKKIAYFTQWGIYGRNFKVKDVDTSGQAAKLTHIHYAFGNVNEQGRCFEANQAGVGDAWADYQRRFGAAESVDGVGDVYNQPLAGNFNQLKKLKAKHPNLKVMFSLGGWTWSKYFSNAVLPANRVAFVQSCIDMFIKGNLPVFGGEPQGGPGSGAGVFDGIDLDWEWPGSEGNPGNVIRPEDKVNFTATLAEFRKQLDAISPNRYQLSAFLPADPAKIDAGFEASKIFSYMNYATVQGYDFYGAWENQTNHQSQLKNPTANPNPRKFSAELAVNAWTSRGAPAAKLSLGVPAYGRGWTGVPNANNGVYQSSTGPAPGTWEPGNEDYKVLKNRSGNRFRDAANGAYWLYDGTQFWSYDDPELIRAKGAWVKSRGLGGLMIWSLDGDDGTLVSAIATGLG